MDRKVQLRHLVQAERHIALGERHIARQVEIIAGLEQVGHPTQLAIDLLATYRDLQVTHVRVAGPTSMLLRAEVREVEGGNAA
jgi:hypothetical protein